MYYYNIIFMLSNLIVYNVSVEIIDSSTTRGTHG